MPLATLSTRAVIGAVSAVFAIAATLPAPAAADPSPALADAVYYSPAELDAVEVRGAAVPGYAAKRTRAATKTDTPLIDVPQSITVMTAESIRDLGMHSIGDLVRHVPGVGIAQGEGNRDTPVFRGNSSTSDLFVDGMRDDVQYFRDFYNIDRVEVLKGANAMIFGRGGSGGVLNRVTKVADGNEHRELAVQGGSWARARATLDYGQAMLSAPASWRIAALYEDSGSYRGGVDLKRYGVNPTLTYAVGSATQVTVGLEHFRDERTADRGVPSYRGRPLPTTAATFFGDPARSPAWADVDAFNATIEHELGADSHLSNRTRIARYDKFYQNVYPGAVSADGSRVAILAYNNATARTNVFNQTDLVWSMQTGGVSHQLMAGVELGRQGTDNYRETGYFTAVGANATSAQVPVRDPRYRLPIAFRQSSTDADNYSVASVASVYVQDQIELSPQWQAVLGLRFDRFEVDFDNQRNDSRISTGDNLTSPRAGLIYKPADNVSVYASYGVAHVPRAGEQLSSLTPATASFAPERFDSYELGAKWDIHAQLGATLALFRLDRSNVVAPDPADPTRSILLDGQYSEGLEFGLSGQLTDAWSLLLGYAYQRGEITANLSSSAVDGAELAQLPRHSGSLWSRYDFSPRWGVGLGVVHRGSLFASTDNAVVLPQFTRFDAGVYFAASERLQLQLNLENLTDRDYAASAHNNNNITPGSPRAAYLSANWLF